MTSPPLPPQSLEPTTPEPFTFVAGRLWLDFVNTDDAARTRASERRGERLDALDAFDRFMRWLVAAGVLDGERAVALLRRATQQPTGASAALYEARRMRNVLRALAEKGDRSGKPSDPVTQLAITEINRILGRSTGSRRVEPLSDGGFSRNFVTAGDVFAALLAPIIETAADALVTGELARVHKCANASCGRVFHDGSRNGKRRWCDMATCGNRAKAARHRRKAKRTR
jgi:predicted RNA-binding Zn ribbon-like protein